MKESKFVEEVVLEGLGRPADGDTFAQDQYGVIYRVDAARYDEIGNLIIHINRMEEK